MTYRSHLNNVAITLQPKNNTEINVVMELKMKLAEAKDPIFKK